MGTRNLTMVIDTKGETKIAQYGQWDGYPDGQGLTVLEFLMEGQKVKDLKDKLSTVRFIDAKGKDKEFIESYNKNAPEWSNEPDNRTEEQISWFDNYIHRDISAKILMSVILSNEKEIILDDSSSFRNDSSCEWCYVIDFQKEKLIVESPYHKTVEFDLNKIPDEERFLNSFKDND